MLESSRSPGYVKKWTGPSENRSLPFDASATRQEVSRGLKNLVTSGTPDVTTATSVRGPHCT